MVLLIRCSGRRPVHVQRRNGIAQRPHSIRSKSGESAPKTYQGPDPLRSSPGAIPTNPSPPVGIGPNRCCHLQVRIHFQRPTLGIRLARPCWHPALPSKMCSRRWLRRRGDRGRMAAGESAPGRWWFWCALFSCQCVCVPCVRCVFPCVHGSCCFSLCLSSCLSILDMLYIYILYNILN